MSNPTVTMTPEDHIVNAKLAIEAIHLVVEALNHVADQEGKNSLGVIMFLVEQVSEAVNAVDGILYPEAAISAASG